MPAPESGPPPARGSDAGVPAEADTGSGAGAGTGARAAGGTGAGTHTASGTESAARRGRWAALVESAHGIRLPGGIRPVPGVVGIAAVVITYYVVPLHPERDLAGRIIASLLGLGIVGAVIIHHVRRGDDPVGRLLLLFTVAVATIALSFHAVAATPGQFEGLQTRTDALYFTVVTLATIGYGDIHPVGQAARVMVVVAMCFHVVFLTMLASVIGRQIRDQLSL